MWQNRFCCLVSEELSREEEEEREKLKETMMLEEDAGESKVLSREMPVDADHGFYQFDGFNV